MATCNSCAVHMQKQHCIHSESLKFWKADVLQHDRKAAGVSCSGEGFSLISPAEHEVKRIKMPEFISTLNSLDTGARNRFLDMQLVSFGSEGPVWCTRKL